MAVRRTGVTTFIIPRRNEVDLDDLPAGLSDHLKFVLVDRIEEAIAIALPEVSVKMNRPTDILERETIATVS